MRLQGLNIYVELAQDVLRDMELSIKFLEVKPDVFKAIEIKIVEAFLFFHPLFNLFVFGESLQIFLCKISFNMLNFDSQTSVDFFSFIFHYL